MTIDVATDLDYLIPELRVQLWDVDSTAYRYIDGWLRVALVASLKALQRWWRIRYTIDDSYVVARYANSTFTVDSPPVIQTSDERPIVLMASILIKSGTLESLAWNLGSWRDAEVAVSNIESGRSKGQSYQNDWNELLNYLKPPTRRLSAGDRSSIPGALEY